MLFDQSKMNVNMSGTEYIKYRESRKIKLSKNQKAALPFFILSFIGIIFIVALISDIIYVPPTSTVFSRWYDAMPTMATMGWSNIGKLTFLAFAPFIVIVVGLAWLFHGFGFLIFKG